MHGPVDRFSQQKKQLSSAVGCSICAAPATATEAAADVDAEDGPPVSGTSAAVVAAFACKASVAVAAAQPGSRQGRQRSSPRTPQQKWPQPGRRLKQLSRNFDLQTSRGQT